MVTFHFKEAFEKHYSPLSPARKPQQRFLANVGERHCCSLELLKPPNSSDACSIYIL